MHFLAINRMKEGVAPEVVGAAIGGHRRWIEEGIGAGWIAQAGKWGGIGGMVLLRAASEDEARGAIARDPLVRSGAVTVELARLWPDVSLEG